MQSPRSSFSENEPIKRPDRRARLASWFVLGLACVFVLSCWLNGHNCSAGAGGPNSVASAASVPARASVSPNGATADANALEAACQSIYQGQFDTAGKLAKEAAVPQAGKAKEIEQIVQDYDQISHRQQEAKAQAFKKQIKELDRLKAAVDLNSPNFSAEVKTKSVPVADPPAKERPAESPKETKVKRDPNVPALAKGKEPNEPNGIPDVLAAVARAREFADANQKRDLLSDAYVKKLFQICIDRSTVLASQGRWLDAYTNYYFWLAQADPNNRGYSDHAEELLDRAGIAASFQDSPCESRKERYDGVTKQMFEKAIGALNVSYVHSINYEKMATAAVKRCDLLAQVLSTAFPEGLDSNSVAPFAAPSREKVNAWSVALAGLLDEIKASKEHFGKDEFLAIMDRALALNKTTVELPSQPLISHAAEAALETLDPYTVMIWPRQAEEFEKLMMNEFTGIGIEISKPKGLLTVASLLPDTPADRAGLDAGDVIQDIDGVPTEDMSLTCAVKKIQGPRGTSVILTIHRTGEDKKRDLSVTRDRIVVPTIRGWDVQPGWSKRGKLE